MVNCEVNEHNWKLSSAGKKRRERCKRVFHVMDHLLHQGRVGAAGGNAEVDLVVMHHESDIHDQPVERNRH